MGSLQEFDREIFVASKKHQITAATAMAIGGYGMGTICAWSAPAIPNLEKTKYFGELSITEKSWCASMVPFGALAFGPFGGMMVDHFGRRVTAMITSVPCLVAWLMIAFAPSMTVLIAGRLLSGMCVGIISSFVPLYISEISEEKIRGALSALNMMMAGLGILNTYILGSFMDWFWLTISNSLVPVALFVCVYFLPESPVYLLSKGRTDRARRSLIWLRSALTSDQIEPELQQLRRGIDEKRDVHLSAKEFFSPAVLKPNLICVALMFFQQMSGINAVIFYTVDIFKSAGSTISPNLSAIYVGIILLISIIGGAILIDKVGRRILLIVSGCGSCTGLLGLGIFFYIKQLNSSYLGQTIDYCGSQVVNSTDSDIDLELQNSLKSVSWLPLFSLMLFVLSYNFGIGSIPWLFTGEILPPHVKGFGAGIATAVCWFMAFLVTKSFEDFVCHLGTYGCFWMFAIMSAVGVVFYSLFVPETKGKTLDEIQKSFK